MYKPNNTKANSLASLSKTQRTLIRIGRYVIWCRNRMIIQPLLQLCSEQPLLIKQLCIFSTRTISGSLCRSVSLIISCRLVGIYLMAGAMKSRTLGEECVKTVCSHLLILYLMKWWPLLKISRQRPSTKAINRLQLIWALMIGSYQVNSAIFYIRMDQMGIKGTIVLGGQNSSTMLNINQTQPVLANWKYWSTIDSILMLIMSMARTPRNIMVVIRRVFRLCSHFQVSLMNNRKET